MDNGSVAPPFWMEKGRISYGTNQKNFQLGDLNQPPIPIHRSVWNTGNVDTPEESGGKIEVKNENSGFVSEKSRELEIKTENKMKTSEATQTGKSLADGASPSKSGKGTANPASITPTVILNGLAMARGENVLYEVVKKTPLPSRPIYDVNSKSQFQKLGFYPYSGNSYNPLFQQEPVKRWIYPYIFHVKVTVGDREFIGEGKSQQAARHSAARSALDALETMPIPKQTDKKRNGTKLSENNNAAQKDPMSKSPISLLYEKVSVSKLKIKFEVISETGAPHLKLFTMQVVVSKNVSEILLRAQGQGNSKNAAKTKAAEAALEKLKENPFPERVTMRKKSKPSENKIAAILSSKNSLHPSSRLSQIMQAKHETLPVYKLIPTDNSNPRQTVYKMQCKALGQTTVGEAKSKKDAKRDASQKMLELLELYSEPANSEEKPSTTSRPLHKSRMKNRSKGTVMDVLPPVLEV